MSNNQKEIHLSEEIGPNLQDPDSDLDAGSDGDSIFSLKIDTSDEAFQSATPPTELPSPTNDTKVNFDANVDPLAPTKGLDVDLTLVNEALKGHGSQGSRVKFYFASDSEDDEQIEPNEKYDSVGGSDEGWVITPWEEYKAKRALG